MNLSSPRQLFTLLGLTVLILGGGELSAASQTANANNPTASARHVPNNSKLAIPKPGTTTTSATSLTSTASPPGLPTTSATEAEASQLAQVDIEPDIGPTISRGYSYIGVAANIGLGGDSDLGDSNFTVISKIAFGDAFAVRPAAVFGDDPVILIPVTYEFSLPRQDAFTESIPIFPFIGGGVAIDTGSGDDVGGLVTAGVDYPFMERFTATVSVNVGIFDDADVGLVVGIGYNFLGF